MRGGARFCLPVRCPPSVPRRILESDASYDQALWKSIAEMGWTGAAIPEKYGGVGLGRLAVCVIAEELGFFLAPVPFASSVYLATEALMLFGSEAQKQAYLPKLATGELIGTFALAERAGTSDPRKLTATVSGGTLTAVKLAVPDGDVADFAVVAVNGGAGPWLYLVDLKASGVSREVVTTIDPTRSHAKLS